MPIKNLAPLNGNAPLIKINELNEFFHTQGFVDWAIISKGNRRTFKGKTADGETVNINAYQNGEFQERTISKCGDLSYSQRVSEAKRMDKDNLTQAEIAARLGVSQKSISNYLRA
jgi:hypothetical protein